MEMLGCFYISQVGFFINFVNKGFLKSLILSLIYAFFGDVDYYLYILNSDKIIRIH